MSSYDVIVIGAGPGGSGGGGEAGEQFVLFGIPFFGLIASEVLSATWAVRAPLIAFVVVSDPPTKVSAIISAWSSLSLSGLPQPSITVLTTISRGSS